MPDMREEFEASGITRRLSRSTEPGFTDLYEDSHTQMAWMAWQASRAALRVEDEIDRLKTENEALLLGMRAILNAYDHGSWPTTVMHGIEKVREVLAGSAPPAKAQHSVPEGYRLIRLDHFAAIREQLNPKQVDAYRGRNVYDECKVYENWDKCRSAINEIKGVFEQIDWDAENELAELLAAAPQPAGGE